MKKIILSIICSLSIITVSNAFFGSPTSIDLYKNIDSGIEKLNSSILTIELSDLFKGINELAESKGEKACLDESKIISEEKFNEIIGKGDITFISKNIKRECLIDKNGNLSNPSIELLNTYLGLFKKYKSESIETSKIKTNNLYKISNIGLYSDGIVKNSGFDLINDIEEIDKIIFSSVVEYSGVEGVDLGKDINNSLDKITKSMNDFLYSDLQKDNDENIIKKEVYPNNTIKNPNNIVNTNNSYVCSENIDNTELSKDSLNFLLNNIKNNTQNPIPESAINNENSNIANLSDPNNNINNNSNSINSNYNKVTDNALWPCETFFCIKVNYITYNHSLFGGGENISIEYLLNRSNKHLKRYVSTSLLPAKMSNNNFELGLKDLNLPDLFHISFQISSKPIPILDIANKSKPEEEKYSSKKLLEYYYKSNGLDYKRRNDITLFEKVEQDKQNLLISQGLSIKTAINRSKEYKTLSAKKSNDSIILQKAIEKEVSYGIMNSFEKQYSELDKFTDGISEYINNLDNLITTFNQKNKE